MNKFNEEIRDYYYLVPAYALANAKNEKFAISHYFSSAYRHDSLDALCRICATHVA
jgi:hypothetical protein